MRTANLAFVAEQFAAVVPVGLHLYQLIVARSGLVAAQCRDVRTAFKSHLLHNPAFSRSRYSSQQQKWLRPHGGEIGAKVFRSINLNRKITCNIILAAHQLSRIVEHIPYAIGVLKD